jgi:signal transduction histidine kinase
VDAASAAIAIAALVIGGIAGAAAVATRRRPRSPVEADTDNADVSPAVTRELAEAETALRDLRLVLDSMDEGVLLFDRGGRVRLANPAAERFLGARPPAVGVVFPLDLRRAVSSAAEFGEAVITDVDVGTPSRSLRAEATPVASDGSVLLVLLDVTEAKRLDAVRRDFVTNASHELKTPAASIQAAAETIATAATQDPAVVPRFAEQLEREAARLSRIVSDLLDLSRLESGSELLDLVRLDAVLRDENERFEHAAEAAGVALTVDAPASPPIRGSARDLSLLVRNLVDNAIRYTKPRGRVDVSVSVDDGRVVLVVADTGIGIPARETARIFERFYRVDRARSRETGGTGLGLSIVKHVIENHGGSIEVRSELGRGTRFEVRLPAAVT